MLAVSIVHGYFLLSIVLQSTFPQKGLLTLSHETGMDLSVAFLTIVAVELVLPQLPGLLPRTCVAQGTRVASSVRIQIALCNGISDGR